MSNCCSASATEAKTGKLQAAECPSCSNRMKPVKRIVLMHQVTAPLNQTIPSDQFFFCSDADCPVVYFSKAGFVIETAQMRGEVGLKSTDENRMICYCFDITYSRVMEEIEQTGHSASKAFVVEQTKLKNCACDIRNPSGKCCLKEFPK
ncbi:hypothetical protein [Neptunomonas sp.]|uniref:putative iron-sulfur cluster-binding metallochaperone n=1 Tax=Neptunomonas sp. TaxID=1971898 RepID=UPI00356A78B1